ncbi:sirohydrochlorin cobaltochelatase [Lactobacillus sp. 3B(2020)]|uniref:sirohydrochlorin cobaltochelatase n=1 Tax=Lactobacillus sp. 3B(2020) TaxID=2695882 RepID=UPI0015DF5BE5|nr:sirohydrochlorin cobaltochelatase [Lactobacillus sp. 3B(2020)]QLL69178.1 sirohydrochlorin cobaltochelatase [Lactobacillus sp. 3B(2020)]
MSKQAILAVSFGTTYPETRSKTIEATVEKIQATYPKAKVVQVFTSRIVRQRVLVNEQLVVDSPEEALKKLLAAGYHEVYIQSLHLLPGWEYQLLVKLVKKYRDDFDILKLTQPLLADYNDFKKVVKFLKQQEAMLAPDEARVWMGHGSSHSCFTSYACLDHMLAGSRSFVAAVESYPNLDREVADLKATGATKIILQPLMLVAGNHAHNDMAQGPDSWRAQLEKLGYQVEARFKGLGEYTAIQEVFVDKLKVVMEEE